MFALPIGGIDDALMPSLLRLSDVMGTGHHAARSAKVGRGKMAAVIGDGAVGLCAVIATRRLGADRCVGTDQAILTAISIPAGREAIKVMVKP